MIINSVIQGQSTNTKTIDITNTISNIFLLEGGSLDLAYTYTDSVYNSAYSGLYLDEELLGAIVLTENSNSWDATTLIATQDPGLHIFHINATNYNRETDYAEFKVLYNYPENNDMLFDINSNSNYTLASYIGTDSSLVILPYGYNETFGILELTIIGAGAFYDNDFIQTVTLPETIMKIESAAFNAASIFSHLIILATTPPELEGNVFIGTEPTLTIQVPVGTLDAYITAWGELTTATIEEII